MKIDFHTHTSRYSLCSSLEPRQLIRREIEAGLDAVVLTEHNQFWPEHELEELRESHPEITIFTGAEVEVESLHHVIVILPDPDPDVGGLKDPDRLLREVRHRGGYTIAAHPYRFFEDYHHRNRDYRLDGVEVASRSMTATDQEDAARRLALKWEAGTFASSDAHSPRPIGHFYTELPGTAHTHSELCQLLHAAEPDPYVNPP